MTLELCTACMSYHEPPKCSHDPEKPCRDCGGHRGYRWQAQTGVLNEPADLCWQCARLQGMVAAE